MIESHPARATTLGSLPIWRALPVRGRRMIGPWCFLDRYGPLSFTNGRPMDVAAHPHIGIRTVSYLLEGEVVHYDSLGYEALLRPGGVNVMTSGAGIAHAEVTPAANDGTLNGVQLWLAMTNAQRNDGPSFAHVPHVAVAEYRGGLTRTFLDPHGVDVEVHSTLSLPLRRDFEHGLFVLAGDAALEGQSLDEHTLYYLPPGSTEVELRSRDGARVLLLGGTPFGEPILMWWNFVARDESEIAAARADWEAGRRFGEVRGYDGPRLHAPDLVTFAHPNPAS